MPHGPRSVALVITGLEPGGAERCLTTLALGLDRSRFTPEVFSLLPRPNKDKAELAARLESAHVPLHFLNARRPYDFFRAAWSLGKHLRRLRPAIVQSFLYHANLTAMGALRESPLLFGIRVADPRNLRALSERTALRFAAGAVCVSRDVADTCKRRGYPSAKLHVIPNSVDVDRFANAVPADDASLQLSPGHRLLVVIGRLHEQKGLDRLLPRLPQVLAKFSDCDVRFIGEGPQRAFLENLAGTLGIASRVAFLGRRTDIPSILKRSELLLLPSRYEGMPNVVLEAMAAGTPVVASRAEGVCELLGNVAEQTTALIGDDAGFAAAVERLLADSALLREIAAKNATRARENFSPAGMVESYQDLWTRVMESPRT